MHRMKPTFWKEVYDHATDTVVLVKAEKPDAHFISSRMMNGTHRILLDVDKKIEHSSECIEFVRQTPWDERLVSECSVAMQEAKIGDVYLPVSRFASVMRIQFFDPVSVYPSSTQGNHHVIVALPDVGLLEWCLLEDILVKLCALGCIESNWLKLCQKYKMAILLKPGVSKETAYAARRKLEQDWSSSSHYVQNSSSPYGCF